MFKRLAIICSLLLATPSFAETYAHFFSVGRDASGVAIAGATVSVKLAGTSTSATLYNDGVGGIKSNPFLSDSLGNYDFWVHPGNYKIIVNKVGVGTFTVDNVAIGTQPHVANHETGGSDPLDLSLIPGTIAGSQIASGAVTNAKVSNSAGIVESKLALNFSTHANTNDPSTQQKAALGGTSGTPDGSNKYVTNSDPRLTNTRAPTAHATSHEVGGSDEISVAIAQITGAGSDLSQSFALSTHASRHQDGGADEIAVTGLSGLLADPQKVVVKRGGTTIGTRPTINFIEGGNTTLTVTDNSGANRVDVQVDSLVASADLPPLVSSHLFVGNASDVATDRAITGDVTISNTGVTAIGSSKVTNAMLVGSIDLTSKVTGVLPAANLATATTSTQGASILATPSSDTTAGHVVQANDARLSDARTPASHAASHQNGGSDEVATDTPGANAIPKAGGGGTLASGWIPTLNQNTSGTAADLSATLSEAHGGTNLTSATDDNIMLGNGATWQSKIVPDCTDTSGNHLNYTAATNTLSCGTSSSGGGGSSEYSPFNTPTVGLDANSSDEFSTSINTGIQTFGNQGTATQTAEIGTLRLHTAASGSNDRKILWYAAPSGVDWTSTTLMSLSTFDFPATSYLGGLVVLETGNIATPTSLSGCAWDRNGGSTMEFVFVTSTSYTAGYSTQGGSTSSATYWPTTAILPVWLQLRYVHSSNTLECWSSLDGFTFVKIGTTRTLSGDPPNLGLMADQDSANVAMDTRYYFLRTMTGSPGSVTPWPPGE